MKLCVVCGENEVYGTETNVCQACVDEARDAHRPIGGK